jgi:nucleotide-binding universal stress UspA family protein
MLSITSIVVASDLTKRSTLALQRAVMLKKQLGAHLTLLHVVDGAVAEPAQAERRREEAKELLQSQLSSVCEEEMRHLWLEVLEGERDTTIIVEAEKAGADLIILGDGRQPGWRQRFVGTTTERIVRLSGCPVLVVRRLADSPYRRLFCAFDGSPAACRALSIALSVANEAECLVMHANDTRVLAEWATRRAGDALLKRHIDTVMTKLRGALQHLAPLPVEPQVRVVEGNAHFLIREHMREFSPDLVALGTHARSPAATAFLGSLARDFLADTDCDMLIAAPGRP